MKFRIEAPDGKVFDVEGPEGSTAEQALAQVQATYKQQAQPPVDPTGSFTENAAAGAGKAIVDMGRGLRQIGSSIPLLNRLETFDPAKVQAEVDESRRLDAPLMKTGGGLTGNIAGNVAATLMVPGAGTYGGAMAAGGVLGALQPTVAGESRLQNATVAAAAGGVGKYAGDKIVGGLANKLTGAEAAATSAAAQNVPRDAALAAGREAGYVVPPRLVQKQGVVGGVLEGFGGKIKLGQQASNLNQPVTNKLARKALGITDDTPITPEVLNGIRAKAGEAYEALRGTGTITADKTFRADLAKITQKYEGAAKDFPDLAKNEIGDIVAIINKPSFSADSAIDAISILRDKAAAAFAKGDKGVGSAYRQTSQAMEDAIERSLLQSGSADAVKAFQAARRLIAKTYSVEKALSTSGDVSAQKLAGQLSRGKPLSDELRTIGEFAGAFKEATKSVGAVERNSVLDMAAAGGLGAMFGLPGAAIPLARPLARSAVLSGTYQKLMATPQYGASNLLRGTTAVSPVLKKLLPGAGAVGALEYAK